MDDTTIHHSHYYLLQACNKDHVLPLVNTVTLVSLLAPIYKCMIHMESWLSLSSNLFACYAWIVWLLQLVHGRI